LEDNLKEACRHAAAAAAADMNQLLAAIRDFATEQLCTGNWPADADLKEYILYASPDLEELAGFRNLPDGLQLRHTYTLFYFLRNA
jgi:hypothetical protein